MGMCDWMTIAWCITQTTDGYVGCTGLVEVDTDVLRADVLALLLAAAHLGPPQVMVWDHGRSTIRLRAVLRLEIKSLLRIHGPTDGRHTSRVTDG